MIRLREVENVVKIYKKNPKKAKNSKEYMARFDKAKEYLKTHIGYIEGVLKILEDTKSESESLFGRITRKVDDMLKNKFTSNLSKAKSLKKELEIIERFF